MYRPDLHFHFTGIGGSGMSGLAEILMNLGFTVSGSDQRQSSVTDRLSNLGAGIVTGSHAAEHVPAAVTALVYSSAVALDNPEVVEARRRGIPAIRRAEVLAELMRLRFGVGVAGSHGKTTTTSMTAQILELGGLDPTVVIGGQVKAIGSGSRLGQSDFLVAETDESDRSFLLLKPTIAVVTNIDAEHLGAYGTLAELERSFAEFVNAVPFYGLAVLCIDDPRVRDLAQRYAGRKVTYGVSPDATIRASNITHGRGRSQYDVTDPHGKVVRFDLPIPGKHMVVNSLAAIAVALELGLSLETSSAALAEFGGVERRLEIVGQAREVTVMNDYGHHPSEIRATLRAVRDAWGQEVAKIRVVFQPHRYSRTRDCFSEFIEAFGDCDSLILTDIYSAGEEPIEGVSGELLYTAISHGAKEYAENLERALERAVALAAPGDMIVCLGAGSIGSLPAKILAALEARPQLKIVAA